MPNLTPNLNLNIPPNGTQNWDVLMNQNFSTLDTYLSGGLNLPALSTLAFVLTPGASFNGVATVGNGLPALYAKLDATAQVANIAAQTLYAVPAGSSGLYKVSAYIVVTSAGTTSTLPSIVITWNDADTGQAQSITLTPTNSGNALTTYQQATCVISAQAGSNIQISTTGYASTGTAMQYAVHAKMMALI